MGIFAYVEGYGAFQKKFSPLVVERAMTLKSGASPVNIVLAPFYSMGLMHATKKRKIVSWSISLSVALLVGVVKRLPCASIHRQSPPSSPHVHAWRPSAPHSPSPSPSPSPHRALARARPSQTSTRASVPRRSVAFHSRRRRLHRALLGRRLDHRLLCARPPRPPPWGGPSATSLTVAVWAATRGGESQWRSATRSARGGAAG